jgi:hypothetical protein
MEVKDDDDLRVNESAPPRVTSAYDGLLRLYAPPELAWSPRLPIMATLGLGPVRANIGTIRKLYSFVPGPATMQHNCLVAYIQHIDVDNMSSDLQWHLLRVREPIFNTLTRYFNSHCCRGTIPSLSSGPRAAPFSPKNL